MPPPSSRKVSSSSTASAQSEPCGQPQCNSCWRFGHPAAGPIQPPMLPHVATPHTQPELIPAFNASQNRPCKRRSMAYAPQVRQLRRRPPGQFSLLSEACLSACGTACPRKQTGLKLSSQLNYAAQSVSTSRNAGSRVRLIWRQCNRLFATPSLPTLRVSPSRE